MPPDERPADPFDPFGQWQTMRDKGMDAWSKMMLDFVHSDAYASASARWLDTYLTMSQSFQQMLSESMSHTLGHAKIASTDDIERLSERLWNLELKLDDFDGRLEQVLGLVKELAEREKATARAVERELAVARAAERDTAAAKAEERKPEPPRSQTPEKHAEPKPHEPPKPKAEEKAPAAAAGAAKHEAKPGAGNGTGRFPAHSKPEPKSRAETPAPPKPQPESGSKEKS